MRDGNANLCTAYPENPKRRDSYGDYGVNRRSILKCVLQKQGVRICTGFSASGYGLGGLLSTE
jgi:hypothetical protein